MSMVKNNKGSAMADVLVSIGIFTMGMMGALSIITSAIQSNANFKNKMMAMYLAEEGIEVVRGIRDTNWMLYPSRLRECWNYLHDITDDSKKCIPNNGQNNNPIGRDGQINYIVDFNTAHRWYLEPATADDDYALYQVVMNKDTDNEMTVHTNDVSNGTDDKKSIFNRQVAIYYLDSNNNNCQAGTLSDCTYVDNDQSLDNKMLVVVTVYWFEKGARREVVLSTVLTDYFDRHEWDT